MTAVRFARAAAEELAEATAWYRARRPGLELEFLAEVEHILPMIGSSPASFPQLLDLPVDLVIRRALLPRFPYAVIFVADLEISLTAGRALARWRVPGFWSRKESHR